MRRSVAIGFLWLIAVAAAEAQPWPSFCVHPIARGETASGQLASTDCNWFYNAEPGNRYYLDVYSFDGTVGQQVSIELKSSAFDAYVKLHDVNEFASLALVTDDNGGGGTNARIPAGSGTYTLPKTGTYYIWASSAAPNAFGAYTLTLNGAVLGPPPTAPNYQGLWWNPLESGWGINFAHQGDIIFATWFTYDAGGKPWWLIAELHKIGRGRVFRAGLHRYRTAVQRGAVLARPGGNRDRDDDRDLRGHAARDARLHGERCLAIQVHRAAAVRHAAGMRVGHAAEPRPRDQLHGPVVERRPNPVGASISRTRATSSSPPGSPTTPLESRGG